MLDFILLGSIYIQKKVKKVPKLKNYMTNLKKNYQTVPKICYKRTNRRSQHNLLQTDKQTNIQTNIRTNTWTNEDVFIGPFDMQRGANKCPTDKFIKVKIFLYFCSISASQQLVGWFWLATMWLKEETYRN